MQKLLSCLSITACIMAQQPSGDAPQLKTRSETMTPKTPIDPSVLCVVAAGTKIPIQLRQPVSTKNAQPGDAIYAQTAFPIIVNGLIAIPAGTWVQGVVDNVKRAGRIKGTAELGFHLTTFIYPNGYAVDIAAAIDQVPGDATSSVREPGTIKHDSEKGKDLERIGQGASTGGQIGAITGVAANPTLRSVGVGGLTGIAAGTLIALLARGSDVRFETGTAVEISLSKAMAIDRQLALRPAQ